MKYLSLLETRTAQHLLAALLLWIFFAETTTSMVAKSPTVDEQAHLMRGYLYLESGDLPFKLGHPILANALNAFPLWALSDLALPADDDARQALQENRWGVFADRFVWQQGHNVERTFFLSRIVTVGLAMVFAALVFRWARQLWGGWGGLVALTLFALDPTIVAHSRFITDDVAVSFFFFSAVYGLWRYLESDQARYLVLAGVAFGLAQGSKFSALLLGPIFVAVVALWPFLRETAIANRRRWLLVHAAGLVTMFAIGGLVLWAGYRFEIRTLSGWPVPVPATSYFEDLIWESKYFGREGYAFLCGDYSATGWWYYFLLAFAFKSPLSALLLLGASVISLRHGANWPRLMTLLLPGLIYWLSTLVVSLNIGYRLFIPILPFLYVLIGRLATLTGRYQRLLLVGALAWSAIANLYIYPDYLAYFNELTGGPDNGWRCLVDSNIDWGQDLPALEDTVERHRLGRIKLSYFGTAHPSYYGLDFEALPTWEPTPEQGNPFARTYFPHDPAPGVYAISATHLQGVVMTPEKRDTYACFREKQPFAKAGYSIFLYRVESTGPPADLILAGLQVDDLAPDTFESLGTNDVRLRWFNASKGLILSAQSGWTVFAEGVPDVWGAHGVRQLPCHTVTGQACTFYSPDASAHAAALGRIEQQSAASPVWHSSTLVPTPDQPLAPLALPVDLGDQLWFLGHELQNPSVDPDRVHLLTFWRVAAPPDGPRAIFVHLLAPDDQVAAQWDGLDVLVEGWREGDTFLQAVSFELPADLLQGQYWLQTGVYNPSTMERLPVLAEKALVTDRILLEPIRLGVAP